MPVCNPGAFTILANTSGDLASILFSARALLMVMVMGLATACAATSSKPAAPAKPAEPVTPQATATAPMRTSSTVVPAAQLGSLAEGMKVDVGGYKLFVRCTGHGSPPAVFDAGANVGHSAWSLVEPKVAIFTTTCVYDRANRENSDEGSTPNTSQQIVHDLHALLGEIQLAGPFVLVGHSFGGMNMGLHARLYPTEAAGLVMVDAAHAASYIGGEPRPLTT